MQLREAIIKRIEYLEKQYKLTSYGLSMRAGIPPSTLNDFFRGKVTLPKIDTILHICQGLDMDLYEFFNDPLFINVDFDRIIKHKKH